MAMPRGISSNGRGGRYIDLANKRFGRLVALRDEGGDRHKSRLWLCRCDCGTEKVIASAQLRDGTSSCGCLAREMTGQRRLKDLTGQRFGFLTVLSRAENSAHGKAMWLTKCDCGTEKAIIGSSMTGGLTKSCGCKTREMTGASNQTHGMSKSPEYKTWGGMIARCTYPSASGFENYGARGITVCARWRDSFEAFLEDVGPKPSPSHSLDRHPDVDGNYEPGNVRWATAEDQARNKRNTVMLTIGEDTKPLLEWCEMRGLNYTTVRDRMNKFGWTPEEALGFRDRRTA